MASDPRPDPEEPSLALRLDMSILLLSILLNQILIRLNSTFETTVRNFELSNTQLCNYYSKNREQLTKFFDENPKSELLNKYSLLCDQYNSISEWINITRSRLSSTSMRSLQDYEDLQYWSDNDFVTFLKAMTRFCENSRELIDKLSAHIN